MRFPKTQNEGNVKADVKKLLDKYDWFWWMPPANGFGQTGISDFHAVRPGVFMVIETKHTKTTHGKEGPTVLQTGFLNSIRAAGHFAFAVNEKNLHQLELFLANFEQAAKLVAQGLTPDAETGGPLLDAVMALTDYPASLEPNMETLQ